MMRRLCSLATLLALPLSPVRAEDWPEFRGPTGQGHVRQGDLPVEWGVNKNVVWKQPIPGQGWSSPVIVADRIYLTTAVPNQGGGHALRALCLDARTGKTAWDREVFQE